MVSLLSVLYLLESWLVRETIIPVICVHVPGISQSCEEFARAIVLSWSTSWIVLFAPQWAPEALAYFASPGWAPKKEVRNFKV